MSSHYAALVDRAAEEYVGPYANIYFKKITTWELQHLVAFAFVILAALELLLAVLWWSLKKTIAGRWMSYDPRMHLSVFTSRDLQYIFINKASIVVFAYHMFQVATMTDTVRWKVTEATFTNSILVLVPMFFLYDLIYTIFHKVLHLRSIYGYIHKHHHRQASPSRGHYDAINVHPFEFIVGEYLNLFVFWAVPCHIFAVLAFMLIAIVCATLNHTRFDVSIPGVYDSKDHLVHHRLPDYNFGQYTMFWDKLYGWHHSWSDSLGTKAH